MTHNMQATNAQSNDTKHLVKCHITLSFKWFIGHITVFSVGNNGNVQLVTEYSRIGMATQ